MVGGERLCFCCPGCRYVFEILFNSPGVRPENFRETDLYRSCTASGLIPRRAVPEPPLHEDSGLRSAGPAEPDAHLAQELTFRIEGMWCGACSWVIEEVLGKMKGIVSAEVFFLSDLAGVRYLPHRIGPDEIFAGVESLGYKASRVGDETGTGAEKRALFVRLGLSAILTMNIMMISLALYGGLFQDLGEDGIRYLSWPLWGLATPVVFWGGYPIIRRAVLGLRHGVASMDTLIAVGSLSAYCYSIVAMSAGSPDVYFDTASTLVTLVLLGRFIEMKAKEKAVGGLAELRRMAGGKVRCLHDGRERWLPAEDVRPGENFQVRTGERVPLDGVIVSGSASLDESVLTGEARPVERAGGDDIMAGALILDGELDIKASHTAEDSSLNRIVGLVHEALARKNPVELLADRITRRLVPAILVLAALTALWLTMHGASGETAMLRALTVLVITCPCALGIATPVAKIAAVGAGRSLGIIIRDPVAFECAGKLDTIILDKTGTVTEGKYTLRSVVTEQSCSEEDALRLAAALEAESRHFLAREIVRAARERSANPAEATEVEEREGLGITGTIEGLKVAAGNRRLMEALGIGISDDLERSAASAESEGATVVFLARNNVMCGFFRFGDELKPGAHEAVAALRKRGFDVRLVSGDSEATTAAVARKLGIDHWAGAMLPEGKADVVRGLRESGRSVGMAGDGLNDAAALAHADVGFAVGGGSRVLFEACDVGLPGGSIEKIETMLDLSATTSRIIRQNLFFAFAYNALGIPLAVTGALTPLPAALAMFASSLTVLVNTLRITRRGQA